MCPPCKVRTVGTFVWRCGYAASAFCDSLRNCAWALPATCGAAEDGGAALGKLGSELCPPCRVRTVGTFVYGGAAGDGAARDGLKYLTF